MTADRHPSRVAIVGTGHRAQTFTEGFARRPHLTVAALCDRNPVRIAHHRRMLTEAGEPEPSAWVAESAEDFSRMLAAEGIEQVLVTTMDSTHDQYIVAALEAGCRVVTEKPMTVDAKRCRRILQTVERTGGDLSVAFNYRFNPVHELVWRQLSEGVIGDIRSVHFEWDLDVRHGADYFRRWHREKANSGGLMVHKSGHHFDLVNWWLGARPEQVFGYGKLDFYGREAGTRSGYRREYERAHGAPEAADDPFALHLADNPGLRSLYLDAEAEDGYLRDRNVFGDGITIEDDMALVVRYATGATMSYHLHAYSPGEGYRVVFNGTGGRLELDVVESRWQPPATRVDSAKGSVHGDTASAYAGGATITVRPLWQPPYEVPIPEFDHAGHGGGDARMLDTLFGPVDPAAPVPGIDHATAVDGALALATGLAANEAFAHGRPVDISEVVEIPAG
ncbi:Gfo/Idh/MocA family protein [Streptomyces sp. TS71-3]|uniref:Gfo/Idh/MocA family protein n=1 Tax=Streptomyces sp. TS71-3 TaxID=2733862 RepID=UPI001B1A36F0|nr:Gfo/Idh/MocA family oxidoreductase [Streptomyces sp. TS71-3]GHJ41343.1 dehydrogenase [Streptomyces sp. TS71-3]